MIRNTCDCAFTFSEISRAYLLGSESLCQRMADGADTVLFLDIVSLAFLLTGIVTNLKQKE